MPRPLGDVAELISHRSVLCIILLAGCCPYSTEQTPEDPPTMRGPAGPSYALFEEVHPGAGIASSNADVIDDTLEGTPEPATYRSGTTVTRFEPRIDSPRVPLASEQPVTAPVRPTEKPLSILLAESLAELQAFAGRPDAELSESERMKKHRVETRLIALHYLLPAEEDRLYLQPLLASLKESEAAGGKSRLLLAAAFFHDLDMETERDHSLEMLRPPQTGDAAFRLNNFSICCAVEGYRRYTPLTRRVLHAGEKLVLYGELENLQNKKEGAEYRAGIDATVSFTSDSGQVFFRQPLSAPSGDRQTFATVTRSQHFQYEFTVPRDLDGRFRMVIEIRDLYAKAATEAEINVRIRR